MGNQVNVGLKFTADTGQAKASIKELQTLLNKVALEGATSSKTGAIGKANADIIAAAEAAKELSYPLFLIQEDVLYGIQECPDEYPFPEVP